MLHFWPAINYFAETRKIDPRERTRYGIYLENDMNLHYDVVHYMEPVSVPRSLTLGTFNLCWIMFRMYYERLENDVIIVDRDVDVPK